MNDHELLELAAKAADYRVWVRDNRCDIWHPNTEWTPWNPLTNDGDALRLAVKLDLLNVTRFANSITVCDIYDNRYQEISDDIYAATRRAIVRAAAEIGRSKQ